MYVEFVPNQANKPAVLLRESFRADGKVKKRTLANLSKWPPHKIEALRRVLKDEPLVSAERACRIVRSLPHGAVAAVLGTLRRCGLQRVIDRTSSRQRDIVVALIVLRVLHPGSKLAAVRDLRDESATSTLGQELGVGDVSDDELYRAMDWLIERQPGIEKRLAKKHLVDGSLVLYDLSSTWLEGRTCPLGQRGYSRDGKKGKLQIVFGLLCDRRGCPVAVEVFEGNTGDPSTLAAQVDKLRARFGLQRVVLVGDRGMITQARIDQDLRGIAGLDWITALRSPQISALMESGAIQLDLFDDRDLVEIEHPDYPGERLVVCRNPRLARERVRKRAALIAATADKLDKIVAATSRRQRRLEGKDAIGVKVGKVLGPSKVAKYFGYEITDDGFRYWEDAARIRKDSVLDGLYVVRTTVPADVLDSEETVSAYKGLAHVERAFRRTKTVDLHVRPIHHRLEGRVRAHVLLCMLAYYVDWHMREALAPLLFTETDPDGAESKRPSVVAPAQRSDAALEKAQTQRTPEDLPVHSFGSLLRHLGTLCRHQVRDDDLGVTLVRHTEATSLQRRGFELLGVGLPA